MALADKQIWELAEPKISDNDHFFWVLGEAWCVYDTAPPAPPPVGVMPWNLAPRTTMMGAS